MTTRRASRPAAAGVAGVVLIVASALLAGCNVIGRGLGAGGGSLEVYTAASPVQSLRGDYVLVAYDDNRADAVSFYLSEVPLADLVEGRVTRGQIVHIDLLWKPRPGRTPMDPEAKNLSVRQIIFVDGEVGVYGGAGFAYPSGAIGKGSVGLRIAEAPLQLIESSDGFNDALGLATMSGSFVAERDPAAVQQIRFALNQLVTNALGRPRLVEADNAGARFARADDLAPGSDRR